MSKQKHHWRGTCPDPDKFFGFIYTITDIRTGKAYVGRKQYHRWSKKKKVGNNDWEFYTGSNKQLNKDIKEHGKEHFAFVIVKNCYTRGQLTYLEANYQHKMDVLTKKDHKGERMYYNSQIGAVKFVPNMDATA